MSMLKDMGVLAAVAFVFATGMACSAGPLIGQGHTSLGFHKIGIGVLFRSY